MVLLPLEQVLQEAWGLCGHVQRFLKILNEGEKIVFKKYYIKKNGHQDGFATWVCK